MSWLEIVPGFLLPSPREVAEAFFSDFGALMQNAQTTLFEAVAGVLIAVIFSFILAFLMDLCPILQKSVYPLMVLTQTIPTVAIAPLLVLWLGYGVAPKIALVAICCFFPITVALFDGFASTAPEQLTLLRSMGASGLQIFWHVKLPASLGNFFSGIRISVSYSIVGAVIAEWLGGERGLGVYMTRVKKCYAFDKMFAVIALISIISLGLMKAVDLLERAAMPWNAQKSDHQMATSATHLDDR